MADDAEAGKDDDVHFRVAEEPQDVLVQHRVTAAGRVEEVRAEVAVHEQHGDGAGQDGQGQQDQPGGDEHRPGEQRHLEQRHAGGAHVQEGGDDVDRTDDRRGARDVNREDREVGRIAALGRRQRRVQHPADARTGLLVAARRQQRGDAQQQARDIEPVAEVVHPREAHVRCTDLQRHEVVTETAEQRRNDDEEHHQHAMIRDHDVPQMTVGGAFGRGIRKESRAFHAHVLHTRLVQFHPHVDGEADRDQARQAGGEKVKNTNVFVIGGHEPAGEEPACVMMVVVAVCGCVCHTRTPSRCRRSGLSTVIITHSLDHLRAPGNASQWPRRQTPRPGPKNPAGAPRRRGAASEDHSAGASGETEAR